MSVLFAVSKERSAITPKPHLREEDGALVIIYQVLSCCLVTRFSHAGLSFSLAVEIKYSVRAS